MVCTATGLSGVKSLGNAAALRTILRKRVGDQQPIWNGVDVMTTKPSGKLTLKDRLSQLNHYRACQLLGPDGKRLIVAGGKFPVDLQNDVRLKRDRFRVVLRGVTPADDVAVTILHAADARGHLRFQCSACNKTCEHVGAAVSVVLENKLLLGLAAEPEDRTPVELLDEQQVVQSGAGRTPATGERREVPAAIGRPVAAVDRLHPSPAPVPEKRTAWRCAARNGASRSALVPTSAPTRSAPASTFCTCWTAFAAKFPESERNKPYRNRDVFVHVLYGER